MGVTDDMKLSPQHLACLYDAFRQLPPFDKWNMPESKWVSFETPARRDVMGEFIEGDVHKIKISTVTQEHTFIVVQTLVHEMIHMAQAIAKTQSPAQHNADFRKRARQVCRMHGWDYKFFVGG
jgi:galactose-1-phosphate uridylyltransferase